MAAIPPRRRPRPPIFDKDWVNFVGGSRWVLGGLPRERFLDQFFGTRDRLLEAAIEPRVLYALNESALELGRTPDGAEALELLQLELRAYKAATDVAAEETRNTPEENQTARSRLAGIGSTIVDSLSDIFDDLRKKNPYAFAALKGLGEILSFFGDK